ncbi:conserved hypothetical protein, partial [Ricinus communis]
VVVERDAGAAVEARRRRQHHRVHQRIGGGGKAAQRAAGGDQIAQREAGRRLAEGEADGGALADLQAASVAGDRHRRRGGVQQVVIGADGAMVAVGVADAHLYRAGAVQRLAGQRPRIAAGRRGGGHPAGAVVERHLDHIAARQHAAVQRAGDVLRGGTGDQVGAAAAGVGREQQGGAGQRRRQRVDADRRRAAGRAGIAGHVGVGPGRHADHGAAAGHIGGRREQRRVHQRVGRLHQVADGAVGGADVAQ